MSFFRRDQDGECLSLLRPWLVDYYTKAHCVGERVRDSLFLQFLRVYNIPSSRTNYTAIILASDSEVQLYVVLSSDGSSESERLNYQELRNSQGAVIYITEFSISIEKYNSLEPPILFVYQYEIVGGRASVPKGKPVWIHEIEACKKRTIVLRKCSQVRKCIQEYNNTFPEDMKLLEQAKCSSSDVKDTVPIRVMLYNEFEDFSLLFDRCIISRMITNDTSELSMSNILAQNFSKSSCHTSAREATASTGVEVVAHEPMPAEMHTAISTSLIPPEAATLSPITLVPPPPLSPDNEFSSTTQLLPFTSRQDLAPISPHDLNSEPTQKELISATSASSRYSQLPDVVRQCLSSEGDDPYPTSNAPFRNDDLVSDLDQNVILFVEKLAGDKETGRTNLRSCCQKIISLQKSASRT